MKKAILMLIVIVAAVYFMFIHGGPFKHDITFQGETYGYAKHMYGGAIDNHFYTPGGVDFNKAMAFIQILEFDDGIPKSKWLSSLTPLLNRYKLRPVGEDGFELAGKSQMARFYYKSYAAPITVDDMDCMAIYITGSHEKPDEDSGDEIVEIIDALKSMRFEYYGICRNCTK